MHLGLQLYSKETPTQAFSSEICNNFWNSYFEEHLWTMASECYYNGGKILRNTSTSCRISHSGGGHGGQGEEHPPHSMIFLNPSPSKLIPPMGPPPHLKMKGGGGGEAQPWAVKIETKKIFFYHWYEKFKPFGCGWFWVVGGGFEWFWLVVGGFGLWLVL